MKRRLFLKLFGAAPVAACIPLAAKAAESDYLSDSDKYWTQGDDGCVGEPFPLIKAEDIVFSEYTDYWDHTETQMVKGKATVSNPGMEKLHVEFRIDKEEFNHIGETMVRKIWCPRLNDMAAHKIKHYPEYMRMKKQQAS